MADIHVASSSRWRLKNKTLTLPARKVVAPSEEKLCCRKAIQDILCSGFGGVTLAYLLPRELAMLELTCNSLRGTLSSESASSLWSTSAQADFRCRRLMLPVEDLIGLTVMQIKSMVSSMRFACGPLNGGPVPVALGSEIGIVSSICHGAWSRSSNFRIITSRLCFTQRCLDCASEDGEDEDEDDGVEAQEEDESILFSEEMRFFGPGDDSCTQGEMLKVSIGCVPGILLLEISNIIKASGSAVALGVDVHLVSPLWPQGLKAQGIKIRVDGSCVAFKIPGFDASDKEVRQALLAPDGVLCVLVIHSLSNTDLVDASRSSY